MKSRFRVCLFLMLFVLSEGVSIPNILVIYTDDQDYRDIHCFGGEVYTPNLNKLASEGTKLTRYYASSSVCSPSRYSLLTGRYASKNKHLQELYHEKDVGFIRWNTHIEGKEKTIAHLLSEHGYDTALVGKHHNMQNEKHQISVDEDADPRDPFVQRAIRSNYEKLRSMIAKDMGFNIAINTYANNFHTLDLPSVLHQHDPDWIAQGAVEFLKDQKKDDPFFLYVGFTVPHGPDNITSMNSDPAISSRGYLCDPPVTTDERRDVFQTTVNAGYPEGKAHLTWLDDCVGRILRQLEEQGLENDTVVFFASDHSSDAKMTCYERGSRTPAIVRWPGHFEAGAVVDEITANIDLVPTLLDVCGIDQPEEYEIDGESLVGLLSGKQTSVRDALMLEICFTKGVVTKDYKYIATRFPEHIQVNITPENRKTYNQEGVTMTTDALAGPVRARYGVDQEFPGYYDDDQFYDLNADPEEQTNLFGKSGYQMKANELKSELKAFLKDSYHSFGEFHQK